MLYTTFTIDPMYVNDTIIRRMRCRSIKSCIVYALYILYNLYARCTYIYIYIRSMAVGHAEDNSAATNDLIGNADALPTLGP